MENRLSEIEMRMMHQDETIDTLNEVLIGQQRQIDRLQKEVELLTKRLQSFSEHNIADAKDETPPPHY